MKNVRRLAASAATLALSAGLIASSGIAPALATTSAPASVKPAAVSVVKQTTGNLNLRASASLSAKVLIVIPKGTKVTVTQTSGVWNKVTYKGKSGWASQGATGSYLKVVSTAPTTPTTPPVTTSGFNAGLVKSTKYVTTQNGSKDAWFTKGLTTVSGVKGGNYTVPKGTPVWKVSGSGTSWKVNVGGNRNVTVKSADLVRTNPALKSNTSGISLSAFKKLAAGNIQDKYLAQTDFGTHALIGAPAVSDLNALNKAFKAKFGEDLYIDLGYRTASQQKSLYNELGSLIAAKPGTSVHEKALSFDAPEHANYGWDSARFKWLKTNAPKYGWIHPQRVWQYNSAGKLNPYREYWHFDYVGK